MSTQEADVLFFAFHDLHSDANAVDDTGRGNDIGNVGEGTLNGPIHISSCVMSDEEIEETGNKSVESEK